MKVTPILQSEAAECGLTALAMVAAAYGAELRLADLRQRFPLSRKGTSLNQLVSMAQQLGFQARALRLELDDLGKLQRPCILHWDLNHFVVLVDVSPDKVTVLDPAFGKRTLPLSAFSDHFTGIALELTPTPEFIPTQAPRERTHTFTYFLKGHGRALAQIFVLSAILQALLILTPFYLQSVVDRTLVPADTPLLTILGIGFGLILLFQVGIGLLRGWAVVYLSSRLGLQWLGHVFAHVIRLPLSFFENRHLGDITSRMMSVQTIQRTLTTSFVEAIIDGLMAIVTLGLMVYYSGRLALITVVAVGLYASVRALAYQPVRERTEQQLVASAKQQTHLLETLRGMQSVKVMGLEAFRRVIYNNLMSDTVNQENRIAKVGLYFNGFSQVAFGVERIAVVWVGAILVIHHAFTVGMLVAYLAYKDQFAERMKSLIDKGFEFSMLRLHGDRLADILSTPIEDGLSLPEVVPPAQLSIDVQGLSFRYAEGEPWVVRNCSFQIQDGESVAVVGASGCGKTTLTKLILGLLKPSEGSIRIGGLDLHQVGPHHLRALMGVVMQDDQLFAGSIADNICLFEQSPDQARIEHAAALASIHEEILAMPMGYHTLIDDMGNSLSGGEKQRLILARALYRHPRVLILDEATSHLDVTRERWVNETIKHLNLTRVIIAHRPETIASADRVLEMAEGKIARDFRPVEHASLDRAAIR